MSAPETGGASSLRLGQRAALLAVLRSVMQARDILEVATPVLAPAAPAERALDCLAVGDAGYLVPSPEHALKRLLIETRRALYQLGPVFRADEIGRWHNPEFLMLEWYEIDAGFEAALDTLRTVLAAVGAPRIARRRSYREVFEATLGLDPLTCTTEALAACAEARGVAPLDTAQGDTALHDRVFWLDLLMGVIVQPELGHAGPEIVTHFPADDAVLIALDPDEPRLGLRFECFWQGIELANGAVELTDADEARRRMAREQAARRAHGAAEPPIDERLLSAMTRGMPDCAGVALGVDRLLALLSDADSIGEVMPFAWPAR